MTIESWLQACIDDADRRGLPELKPLLETLARATTALRKSSVASRQSAVAVAVAVDGHQSQSSVVSPSVGHDD
jgi:hypothetical protein